MTEPDIWNDLDSVGVRVVHECKGRVNGVVSPSGQGVHLIQYPFDLAIDWLPRKIVLSVCDFYSRFQHLPLGALVRRRVPNRKSHLMGDSAFMRNDERKKLSKGFMQAIPFIGYPSYFGGDRAESLR